MPLFQISPLFVTYLEFATKEIANFQVYVNAAIIGSIICFLTDNYSAIPFIVPLFVQVVARTNVKYRQRHTLALIELPAKTEDPVFIMDMQGTIILSTGNTLDLFKKHSIKNIMDFIDRKAFNAIIEMVKGNDSQTSFEAYSDTSQQWYEIKAKITGMNYGGKDPKVLVWFQNITLRKTYDSRLRDLLRYSDSLIISLKELVKSGSVFEHLASFLLKDYKAVFITRADKKHNLIGYVYKKTSKKIKRSETIIISKESPAPINVARKEAQILSDDISCYDSTDEFLQKNPLDPRVLDFIGIPIQNFITYNEADISIIAFNFKTTITPYEKSFFEILVNIYRTMVMLVDLEHERRKYLS